MSLLRRADAHPRPGGIRGARGRTPSRRTSTAWASPTARTGWATSPPRCRAIRPCRRSWSSPTWTSWASSCARSSPPGSSGWSVRAASPSARCRPRPCCSARKPGDLPGVISNKSHHATTPDEKYQVVPYARAGRGRRLRLEGGGRGRGRPHRHARRLPAACPRPGRWPHGRHRRSTTERAARRCSPWRRHGRASPGRRCTWSGRSRRSTTCAGSCRRPRRWPRTSRIAIDTILACDTPEVADRGDVELGGGPAISMFSFHGRGTLNGVIPHPGARAAHGGGRGGRGPAACSARRTPAC